MTIYDEIHYDAELPLKPDDGHIVKLFGAALRNEIKEINLHQTEDNSFNGITRIIIDYGGRRHRKWLSTTAIQEVDYKDINKYYEITTKKDGLVKLRIDFTFGIYYDNDEDYPYICDTMPFYWGCDEKYDYYDLENYNLSHHYYVGPIEEKDMVIIQLREFYAQFQNVTIQISIVEVEDSDLIKEKNK